MIVPCLNAFALSGRGDSTMRKTQGVASLALGYVLHWAFSPSLLNPKLQSTNFEYLLTTLHNTMKPAFTHQQNA